MIKKMFSVLASIFLAMFFVSCEAEADDLNFKHQPVSEVVVSQNSITLKQGAAATLTARVGKWNSVSTQPISWNSSDKNVVTVNNSGMLTAVSIGEADVIASSDGKSGTCHVTVVSSRIPAESVSLDSDRSSISINGTTTLKPTISPSNSTDTQVWTSSDETIATVDASGTVTGKSGGYAKIQLSVGDARTEAIVLVHGNLWLEQVDPLIKPTSFEEHPFETDTIRVARGETATVQMMVYCQTAQGIVTPSITKFAKKGSSGVAITPELSWVRSIRCSYHWDAWAGGAPSDRYPDSQILIPDVLMPLEDWQVDLPQGNQTAFWAEFDIPRTFDPGIYEGVASISGTENGELPFVVEVYDVTLPESQTLDVIQWINSDLKAMNNNEPTDMYAVYDMFENIIVPFISKYGQNSFNTQYYHRYNIPQVFVKGSDGGYELKLDFGYLEREINMYLRACPDLHYIQAENVVASREHINDGILVLTAYELNSDGSIKLTDNGDGTYSPTFTYVDQKDQYSPEAEAYYSSYYHALQEFLRSHKLADGRTWLDIFLQTICDEPVDASAPAYERVASYVKKGAPDIKLMDPLTTHKISSKYLDFPAPGLFILEGEKGYDFAENQTPWLYYAMAPQGEGLNRFIRIPLIKTRLINWLNYKYSTVGLLHWGLNYWAGAKAGNPWSDANGDYLGGDMWIIWPGYKTVYPSIRLAAMRDGIRDYELLRMTADRSKTVADEICKKVATTPYVYSTDVKSFRMQRKAILDYLSGRN